MKATYSFLRYILLIIPLCFASNSLLSQFAIGIGYGYGLPLSSQELEVLNDKLPNGGYRSQIKGNSYAKGIYKQIEFSFSFHKVTISCIGTKMEGDKIKTIRLGESNDVTTISQSNTYFINPNVKINHHKNRLHYFCRFGGGIGINGRIETEVHSVGTLIIQNDYKTTRKSISDGNYSYSIMAGTGIGYRLWKGLKIELELFYNNGSYSPNRWRLVEYTKNGVDQLPTLPLVEKETIISDGYFIKENSVFNPDEPRKGYRGYSAYSAVGLRVGVLYEFGSKE